MLRPAFLFFLCTVAWASVELQAQMISNPSFEGTATQNVPPDSWQGCHQFSTPDTQPGFWEVTKAASDGDTYVGLVTRGNLGPYADQNEDVETALIETLLVGEELRITIDLSYSEDWGHTINFGSTFLAYDKPGKLQVWGGNSSCEQSELLWESPVVDHTDWKTYQLTLAPLQADVNYLILRAAHAQTPTYFGNVLVDNIFECSFELEWVSDTTICEHEPWELDVTIPNGTYLWQDGSTDAKYTINSAGTYAVNVSNGCISKDYEVVVATRNCFCDTAVPIQTIPFDSLKCAQVPILLDAETPGGLYQWSTGSQSAAIVIEEAGVYIVEVTNRCETQTFEYLIETAECTCEISAPNAFTPNGDGINDTFEIEGTLDVEAYQLQIVNRQGKVVYQTDRIDDFWDGKQGGSDLPTGVYYYVVELGCVQGEAETSNSYRGWVTIVR